MAQEQLLLSAKFLRKFPLDQSIGDNAEILSLLNDKLLISTHLISYLLIYSQNGSYLSTCATDNGDLLMDATWTPSGFILYSTNNNKIVKMAYTGILIKRHGVATPYIFTVSNDNVIYISCGYKGVLQSTDDGGSWSVVLKEESNWSCWQAFKVTSENGEELWIKTVKNRTYHLRAYKMINGSPLDENQWKNINANFSENNMNNILSRSAITYDSNNNIIINAIRQKTIYVLSVIGKYGYQLLSSDHFKHKPNRIAVDRRSLLMYILQDNSTIEVFQLQYEQL